MIDLFDKAQAGFHDFLAFGEDVFQNLCAGAELLDQSGNLAAHEAAVFLVAVFDSPAEGADGQLLDFLKGGAGPLPLVDPAGVAGLDLAAGGAAADFAGDGGVGVLCAQNQFLIGGVNPALFGS